MQGKIEFVDKSKSGKSWRVKIGGKYYGANFDSQIDTAKGKTIDFTSESDPKFGDWIKSWAYASPGTTLQTPVAAEQGGEQSVLTDAEMRFISNVVGQAILAKTLMDPTLIGLWAKAARQTLREL